MKLEDYKTILYRQDDGSWVAEIPEIPGCYALMETREAAQNDWLRSSIWLLQKIPSLCDLRVLCGESVFSLSRASESAKLANPFVLLN